MTIEITKINKVEFKKNVKNSNYYIKEENSEKFVRVRVAEYNAKMEEEKAKLVKTIDFDHYLLLDKSEKAQIENAECFDLSIHRKQYVREFAYLAESIARKYGVQFVLTTKRINGHRAYRFYGNLENIEKAINAYQDEIDMINQISEDNYEIAMYAMTEIQKNFKNYQNIDHLTASFFTNKSVTTIKL